MKKVKFCKFFGLFQTCFYVTKIIGPVASRCSKLRFKPLERESKEKRLKTIAEVEKITLTDDAMTGLLDVANGDLRRAVNYLQSAVNIIPKYTENTDDDEEGDIMDADDTRVLERKHVNMVAVTVDSSEVENVFECALNKEYEELKKSVDDLAFEAYSCSDVLSVLLELVVESNDLSNVQKAYIMDKIGEADGALVDGSDEFLQMLNVFSYIQVVKKCK